MTDVVSKLGKATVVFRIAKTEIPMRLFRMPLSSWSGEGIIAESLDHRLYLLVRYRRLKSTMLFILQWKGEIVGLLSCMPTSPDGSIGFNGGPRKNLS